MTGPMWIPTRAQRLALATAGAAGLAGTLIMSFIGPVTVETYGPAPANAMLQLQLLEATTVLSAVVLVLAGWRSFGLTEGLPLVAGLGAIVVGGFLAFGVVAPTGHGAYTDPYGLQGTILIGWGLVACVLTILSPWIRDRLVRIKSRGPQPAR
ncbi:MAG: hypothetical protein L3K14_07985 [Thermoplasmata archaeon]|nr:hypothetical protein [Thermoplasmata archaeon]